MYYCLYEIRNVLNDKIYVGVHKTKNLDDGYMGSGKVIKRAIEKHGAENFTKVILETFDDSESMYAREKEVVTDEFLDRDDTYNLRRGGNGGFDYINKIGAGVQTHEYLCYMSKLGSAAFSRKYKTDSLFRDTRNAILEVARKNSKTSIKMMYPDGLWKGRKHKEETKRKMSDKAKLRTGAKNSSFGTCWIYNESGNKKIKKDDLEQYLNDGWIKGRLC